MYLLVVLIFVTKQEYWNCYEVKTQRLQYGMLGHSPVPFSDQHIVS
jgi:hypothetical protein